MQCHLVVQKGDIGGKDHDTNHDTDYDDNGSEENNGSEQNIQSHGLFPDSPFHSQNLPIQETTQQHGITHLTEDLLLHLRVTNSLKLWLKRNTFIPAAF